MVSKENTRKKVLARRNNLSAQEVKEKSKMIFDRIIKMAEFVNAKTVCTYISFGNEVSTHEIIEECSKLRKRVVIPAMVGESDLVAAEFLGFHKLRTVMFGIQEPHPIKEVHVDEIDLVLAPGVAFSRKLDRIGFGKGYYDKFLARLSHDVPVIALAYDFQIVEDFETFPTDVKMTKIVTEAKIIG